MNERKYKASYYVVLLLSVCYIELFWLEPPQKPIASAVS